MPGPWHEPVEYHGRAALFPEKPRRPDKAGPWKVARCSGVRRADARRHGQGLDNRCPAKRGTANKNGRPRGTSRNALATKKASCYIVSDKRQDTARRAKLS